MALTPEELAEIYPVAFHMAWKGSWPSIRKRGLLSTSELLNLYKVTGERRNQLERERRPESVTISRPTYDDAVVRDQKPMSVKGLQRALQGGLSPADWFQILNSKAFFWVRRERLETMMNARAYRDLAKTVLEVDTLALVEKHAPRVRLATINTGATFRFPAARGQETFQSLAGFPAANRRRVVELAVEGGVSDISDFTLRVIEVKPGEPDIILWERD